MRQLRVPFILCFGLVLASLPRVGLATEGREWRSLFNIAIRAASDQGTVAGEHRRGGARRAVLQRPDGSVIQLPDFGQSNPQNGNFGSSASGISSDGRVAGGTAYKHAPIFRQFAVQWIDGELHEVRHANGSPVQGEFWDVSWSGRCVGAEYRDGAGNWPIVCDPFASPQFLPLPPDARGGHASAISPAGTFIVGSASFSPVPSNPLFNVPIVWSASGYQLYPSTGVSLRDVADNGLAVGVRGRWDTREQAVILYNGVWRDLPHPFGQDNHTAAHAVSHDGRYIVGTATVEAYDPYTGDFWERRGAALWEMLGGIVIRAVSLDGPLDDLEGFRGYRLYDAVHVRTSPLTSAPIVSGNGWEWEPNGQVFYGKTLDLSENIVQESLNELAQNEPGQIASFFAETTEGVVPDPRFSTPEQQLPSAPKWMKLTGESNLIASNTLIRAEMAWRYVGIRQPRVRTSLYMAKGPRDPRVGGSVRPGADLRVWSEQRNLYPGELVIMRQGTAPSAVFVPDDSGGRLRQRGIFGSVVLGFVLDEDNAVEEVDETDNLNTDALTLRRHRTHADMIPFLLADPTFYYRVPTQAELTTMFGVDADGQPRVMRSYDTREELQAAYRAVGFVNNFGWRKRASYSAQEYSPFLGRTRPIRDYDVQVGIVYQNGRYFVTVQDYSRRLPGLIAREPGVLAAPHINLFWTDYVYKYHTLY